MKPASLPIRAYGEHDLASARRLKLLCLTEGESDYWTLRAAGFPALGVPGAEMLKVLRPELFVGIERVYIMQDADAAGARFVRESRRELAEFGVPASYPVPMPDGSKDVNDLYRRGAEAFKATMTKLLTDVRDGPVPRLPVAVPSTEPDPTPAPGLVLVCLADVQPEEIAWVWPQRLARGKLTLLLGDPGVGKSTLALDVIARITRGAEWPDGGRSPAGTAILMACEDGLADTIRPRLDRQHADVQRVLAVQASRGEDGTERHFSIERDLRQLAKAIADCKPIVVVMDPLSAYFGTGRDSYKDTEVRAVLAPLVALAERTGTAILGLMHMTKAAQQKALYRALGSIAFSATARIVLAAAKDPAMDRYLLMASKQNICRPSATLAYAIGADRLTWEADAIQGVSVEAVLGGHTQFPDADKEDAAAFLFELLSDAPLPQGEVEQAGKGNGFTISQLRRAKRAAGVVSEKSSFRGGVWVWRLTSSGRAGGRNASMEEAPKVRR